MLDATPEIPTLPLHKDLSETICPLPFMHAYIKANGKWAACCESQETVLGHASDSPPDVFNNESFRRLRKSLIHGQRPELCKKCWHNEDLGISSNRQDMWKNLQSWLSQAVPPQVRVDGCVDELPSFLELKLNNLCNLKCIMCHPTSSHRLVEDREVFEEFRPELFWPNRPYSSQDSVEKLLNLGDGFFRNLKVLQFSGGEPLISPEHHRLLEKLLKTSPERYELRYSTNLTQLDFRETQFLASWKRFRKINLKVSIDGIEDVYNYIRTGAEFSKVIDNLKKVLAYEIPQLQVHIGLTVQAHNVFQLPEFLKFFSELLPPSMISTQLLHDPPFLTAWSLPDRWRGPLLRKLEGSRDQRLLSIATAINKQPLPTEQTWNRLLGYSQALEKKQNKATTFEALLERYLGGY